MGEANDLPLKCMPASNFSVKSIYVLNVLGSYQPIALKAVMDTGGGLGVAQTMKIIPSPALSLET